MKIGVVSDTHSRTVPKQLIEDFKKVDMIIHAGDFCLVEDVKLFRKLNKELKAVYGNMDDPKVREIFPERDIFKVEKVTVGLFHGAGAPRTLFETVKSKFKDRKVDLIIFGHSHVPLNEMKDGVLYFNPGSPNDQVFAPYCSYGMLEIQGSDIQAKIIKVEKDNG